MPENDFDIRDIRHKEKFVIDDVYLNGYAKVCGVYATAVYMSLCRHADTGQKCFPSLSTIASQHQMGRASVVKALKTLESYNIIKRIQNKVDDKKFVNNIYFLIDKKNWKPIEVDQEIEIEVEEKEGGSSPHDHPLVTQGTRVVLDVTTPGHVGNSKDTHIKDTHIRISKDIGNPPSFGNENVNIILQKLKETMNIPMLDESEKINRQYANLLLIKYKSVGNVVKLIELAGRSSFWKNNITSTKDLYYKGVKIMSNTRGGVFSGKRSVDAEQIRRTMGSDRR